MSKHAPGPWVIDMEASDAGDICPKNDFDISICEVQRADYSSKTGRYFDGQTTKANRQLIAAAPDLLEALIDAEKKLCIAEQLLDLGEDDSITFESEILNARAAIAKATGQ